MDQLYQELTRDLSSPLLKLGGWLLMLAATIVLGVLLTKALVALVGRMLRRTSINNAAIPFLCSVLRIFCYVLVGISVADAMNIVEPSSIVTALGAVGLALSLAVKDSLANLAGGVQLVLTKTFQLGDYVDIDGISGTVTQVELLHTTLNTPDNKRIMIPNGQVTTARITNYSSEASRRVDVSLTISRDSDLTQAERLLTAEMARHPLVLKEPPPTARVDRHDDLGMVMVCKAWTDTADYWTVYYDLQEKLKGALDQAKISMPVRNFPAGNR